MVLLSSQAIVVFVVLKPRPKGIRRLILGIAGFAKVFELVEGTEDGLSLEVQVRCGDNKSLEGHASKGEVILDFQPCDPQGFHRRIN